MRKAHALIAVSAAALGALLLSAVITTSPGEAAGTVLFGIAPLSDDRLNSLRDIEDEVGRELDLVRAFERWDDEFGGAFHSEIENSDRVMLLSVRAKKKDGSVVLWRDIANANPGSEIHNQMVAWADGIEAYDGEVWFTFNHEPESSANYAMGDEEDFVDAWRAFVDLFRERGLTNVKYNWVMTYWAFATDPSEYNYAPKWYPGDDYVDYIASDAYNWNNCKGGTTDPWRPLAETIEAQRQFGLDHPDKGLVLAEWASTEAGDGGAAKAAWIAEAQELFKSPGWEQFVALSWFHVDNASKPDCKWRLDSSNAAMAAFVEMASDPYYGGSDGGGGTTTTQPPSTTTPPPVSTTTSTTTTSTTTTSTTTTAPPGGGTTTTTTTTTTVPPGGGPTTTTTLPPGGEPPPPDPGEDGFIDVDEDHVFYADIVWLVGESITLGCNPPENDLFCPDDFVTRGQMAAFLVRALQYSDNGGGDLFIDDDTSIFERDIDRLATAEVTRGCDPPANNRFCPTSLVTRGQMAAFLVRALGYTDDGGGDLFIDDDDSIFESDIDKLATAGVTYGCNPPVNDMFCPDDHVTRGQMAAFLRRALG